MEDISLNLTERHMGRLRNGHTITIKPEMVGAGMKVKMDAVKAKKIMSATRRQKGARLALTPEECDMTGGKLSWKGFKRGVKKGWEGYKKYAKPIVSPLVKGAIKLAAKEAPKLAAMAGAPELAPVAAALAPALEEAGLAIGKVTGAYAVRRPRKGMKKVSGKGVRMTSGGAAILRRKSTCGRELPASSPLIDVGNLQYGQDLIKGRGLTTKLARFNTAIADPSLPASNPLIDVGNLQYGQDLIPSDRRGGNLYAGSLYLAPPRAR